MCGFLLDWWVGVNVVGFWLMRVSLVFILFVDLGLWGDDGMLCVW